MIEIRVRLDTDERLEHLDVRGHASLKQGSKGNNVVCAAVTGVVRSVGQAIAANPGIRSSGAAPAEGELWLSVDSVNDDQLGWLSGVTQVLLVGVGRMAEETPDEVGIAVEGKGVRHGS